ncbi:MAG: 30S ribosome-binding factor RbfA [Gammaproteobacteria bacterium]
MKEFNRTHRMADQIQRELAQLIQQQIADPRLGMVTVSAVEVSRDLAHAKVFVSVLDEQHDIKTSIEILNNAAGHLRHELSQRTKMRITPRLRFVYDPTLKYGSQLSALIDAAVSEDRTHQK